MRASAPAAARVSWVDAAKGMSILLVVVHHIVLFLVPYDLVPQPVWAADVAITSLRMPLFFLASGLFLAKPLAGSWRTILHKRVALFAYLYVLWTLLLYGWFQLVPGAEVLTPMTTTPGELVSRLVVPGSSSWFLYALALFSVLAKLVRRVPTGVQLAVSGAISVCASSGLVDFGGETWTLIARCLFFFLLGCYARPLVEGLAARARWWTVALAGLGCMVVASADVLGLRWIPGVAFGFNVAAVTLGVLLAALLARYRLARPLVALGQHTLPVYLLNVFLVSLAVLALRGVHLPAAAQYAAPVVLAVLVTGTALLLHRLLNAAGARVLFGLPARLAYRPVPDHSHALRPSPFPRPAAPGAATP
ncbi:acyltransferase family protein [Pseudonocardia endophytica]|uniref:acyltransferase family protein n=1 Tax=Pseudonocardia endophytica TaxID=401976 RepID=UPI001404425E|nr:acyltransferase family protein [Pseudonocardia endophytica]